MGSPSLCLSPNLTAKRQSHAHTVRFPHSEIRANSLHSTVCSTKPYVTSQHEPTNYRVWPGGRITSTLLLMTEMIPDVLPECHIVDACR